MSAPETGPDSIHASMPGFGGSNFSGSLWCSKIWDLTLLCLGPPCDAHTPSLPESDFR